MAYYCFTKCWNLLEICGNILEIFQISWEDCEYDGQIGNVMEFYVNRLGIKKNASELETLVTLVVLSVWNVSPAGMHQFSLLVSPLRLVDFQGRTRCFHHPRWDDEKLHQKLRPCHVWGRKHWRSFCFHIPMFGVWNRLIGFRKWWYPKSFKLSWNP